MTPEPSRLAHRPVPLSGAALALFPIGATVVYYGLPSSLSELTLVQFTPQVLAYCALGVWASHTPQVSTHLGLIQSHLPSGLKWGMITGLILGCLNTFIILSVYPALGYDITFLKQTPHGRLPFYIMVPWFTCAIALFVEINFRGFLLGRLAEFESHWRGLDTGQRLPFFALTVSALTFAFDPFMVNTFRYLHWIAVWDGLIWGTIWLRTHNLWITIVAHALEVIIMYSAVKAAIG